MTKYIYSKTKQNRRRVFIKIFGLLIFLTGFLSLVYFSLPVITSYAMIQHIYSKNNFTTPIPRIGIITTGTIKAIAASAASPLQNTDYTDATNWFPSYEIHPATPKVDGYRLNIEKIGIKNAYVSTKDYNVGIHLVNYGGTAVPPDKGNAVVFGHSTLPQLFSLKDYKTIFAKLHMLEKGDIISVVVENEEYKYKILSLSIVSPQDFSPLTQQYDSSYLTLITCTPPGTTLERLIVRSVLIE